MTKPFRLNRRSVLRGAGGIAIALPWLEAMAPERASHAATALPRRFLSVYNPGGTILERWTPTGTEDAFALSPILAPFETVKDRVLVLSGIDIRIAGGGGNLYSRGMSAWLTGTAAKHADFSRDAFATGPSIDQVLAARIAATRPRSSLNLGVRWGTGLCLGKIHSMDIVSYGTDAAVTPIAPLIDPVAIWSELFGTNAATLTWEQSVLDAVDRRYARLAVRLGAADRQRLEQHLTSFRELEQRLAATGSLHQSACSAPALPDTSAYDPASGLTTSGGADVETDALIPLVGKLMMDMMVMALACDITAVGSLQWSDAEAEYTLPWLGLIGSHKCYMNDCGFNPTECEAIATWYSQQHAYLLGRMAEIDMGGHSLLDETVVFIGSDIQGPSDYGRTDMPFLLAGGGGLRTGRWLSYDHVSHNDLLVSLLQLFGGTETTFGDPGRSSGRSLPNLS